MSISTNEAVMNVHERLRLIAKKYPELKPLANRLVKEQMTPVWYRDYRALNCRAKPVLLQIYLGKPWLVSNLDEQYGSRKASIRLFKTLLAEYPELPDTPLFAWQVRRSAVPVSFARQLSLPRVSGSLQFRDWLFSGKLPATDDKGIKGSDSLILVWLDVRLIVFSMKEGIFLGPITPLRHPRPTATYYPAGQ